MKIKNEELKELVHSYGANLRRWPWGLRDAARRMLAANPELLAEAEKLDHRLDEFTLVSNQNTNTELLNLIMQSAKREEDKKFGIANIMFVFRPAWAKTAMLLLCALSGLFLGSLNLVRNSGVDMIQNDDQEIFGPTNVNEVLP